MPTAEYLQRLVRELSAHLPGFMVKRAIERARGGAGGKSYPPSQEISPDSLQNLSNKGLLYLHRKTHSVAHSDRPGASWETLVNSHALLAQEMMRRGISHPEASDLRDKQLHEASAEFEKAEAPIILVPNFVSQVGSSVDSQDSSDIDVLIRLDKDKVNESFWNPSFGVALRKRLLPTKEKSLHLIFDEQGPHDRFRPLYHLALIPARQEIQEVSKNKPFHPWKTAGGLDVLEFDSDEPDKIWDIWAKDRVPVFVQEKYDGFRVLIVKDKGVKVFTEDWNELNLPSVAESVSKLQGSFILDGELELYAKKPVELAFPYKPGQKIERADMPSFLKSRPVAEFEPKVFVFDYLGNPKAPYRERFKQIPDLQPPLYLAWSRVVETKPELVTAVKEASRRPNSEGAILKQASAPYTFGTSSTMAKAKNYKEIIVLVKDKERTKAGTYVYTAALRDGTIIGRTLATKIDVPIGSHLEIRAAEIKVRPNGKVTWDNPIVKGTKGPTYAVTSLEQAKELARFRRSAVVIKFTEFGEEVPSFGPKDAPLAIVGDAPGHMDAEHGKPFIGPSGQFLRKLLERYGVDPNQLYWTNVYTQPGEAPTDHRTSELGAKLLESLDKLPNLKAVLALSVIATQALTGQKELRAQGLKTPSGIPIISTYHPSALLRTGRDKSKYFVDFAKDIAHALYIAGLISKSASPAKEVLAARLQIYKAQLFSSIGGKRSIAKLLVSMFPPHKIYVEPFAGGAACFFAKEPSPKEVLSDLNTGVIWAYKTVQNLSNAEIEALKQRDWTVTRERFDRIRREYREGGNPGSKLDKLYRYLYIRHAIFGAGDNVSRSVNIAKLGKELAIVNRLAEIRDRLKGVKILHADALKLIPQLDSKDTFFYLDPTYPGMNRTDYAIVDFTKEDLAHLFSILRNLKGKFLLSIPSVFKPMVPKEFKVRTIRVSVPLVKPFGNARYREELIVANYDIPEKSQPDASDVHVPQFMYNKPGGIRRYAKL